MDVLPVTVRHSVVKRTRKNRDSAFKFAAQTQHRRTDAKKCNKKEAMVGTQWECALFDHDGTLVDTLGLYYASWKRACEKHTLQTDEGEFLRLNGKPLRTMIVDVVKHQWGYEPSASWVVEFMQDIDTLNGELRRQMSTEPIECVVSWARHFHSNRIPCAVVTCGHRKDVIQSLEEHDLMRFFNDIVFPDDIAMETDVHPRFVKTAMYSEAMRRLGCSNPGQCMVFEDSEIGLQSADKAGMSTVNVRFMLGYSGFNP